MREQEVPLVLFVVTRLVIGFIDKTSFCEPEKVVYSLMLLVFNINMIRRRVTYFSSLSWLHQVKENFQKKSGTECDTDRTF